MYQLVSPDPIEQFQGEVAQHNWAGREGAKCYSQSA
jgi:hypothetical protein